MNLTIEKTLPKTTEELVAELYRTKGKAEIINGKVVVLPSDGFLPSCAISNIAFRLKSYEKKTKSGVALLSKVAFLVDLPGRKSFSASCSFYTGERTGMKFHKGAPIFAVVVRNEWNDGKKAERHIADKRMDYFAAGTEIVGDVNLRSDDAIRSFNRDNPSEAKIYRRSDAADAELALPGWEIAVDELFD